MLVTVVPPSFIHVTAGTFQICSLGVPLILSGPTPGGSQYLDETNKVLNLDAQI